MSDFSYQPAFSAQVEHAPSVLVATFGDGFEQRAADGINTDLKKWNLTFTRDTSDIVAIDSQLAGYGAVTSFTWTPSGETEIRVVCRKWSRTRTDKGIQAVVAMFEEVLA